MLDKLYVKLYGALAFMNTVGENVRNLFYVSSLYEKNSIK